VHFAIVMFRGKRQTTYHWHSNQHHDDTSKSTATSNIGNYSCDNATLTRI